MMGPVGKFGSKFSTSSDKFGFLANDDASASHLTRQGCWTDFTSHAFFSKKCFSNLGHEEVVDEKYDGNE